MSQEQDEREALSEQQRNARARQLARVRFLIGAIIPIIGIGVASLVSLTAAGSVFPLLTTAVDEEPVVVSVVSVEDLTSTSTS